MSEKGDEDSNWICHVQFAQCEHCGAMNLHTVCKAQGKSASDALMSPSPKFSPSSEVFVQFRVRNDLGVSIEVAVSTTRGSIFSDGTFVDGSVNVDVTLGPGAENGTGKVAVCRAGQTITWKVACWPAGERKGPGVHVSKKCKVEVSDAGPGKYVMVAIQGERCVIHPGKSGMCTEPWKR